MIFTPILQRLYPWVLFREDSGSTNWVYLTFDDGPDPDSTPAICDVLAESQIPASFFVVGTRVKKAPHILRLLRNSGHLICNHSYSHRKSLWMSREELQREIQMNQEIIHSVVGQSPTYYRPPYGRIFPGLRRVAGRLGVKVVLWDVFVPDYNPRYGPDQIKHRIKSRVRNGSIILLHDCSNNVSSTVKILPELIQLLLDRHFTFTTLLKSSF